jgi:diguanylate cyclase (GGDEF)-like protein/PAS domain S-box-containing protein
MEGYMQQEKNRRILIVDDTRTIHDDFRKILGTCAESAALDIAEAEILGTASPIAVASRAEVFDLDSAYQGQEAWEKVKAAVASGTHYAMAFVDMRMPPGWDGVETITKMWEADPDIQVVICTAYSDYSWEEIIKKLGNVDRLLILKKPFDTLEVCQLAHALTQKWHLAKHAHLKLNQLQAMVREQTSILQTEITERRRSEEAMRLSQGRYALAVAGANDGIWDWDFPANSVFYSTRWKSMLGLSENEVSTLPEEWFNRVHPDDAERVKADLDMHLTGRSDLFHSEFRMRHKDQQYRWILSRGVAVLDEAGKPLRAAGSQTDITDRKMAEVQLRHEALHDTLTGLANRALLMDRIAHRIRHTHRGHATMFAVIFLDIDRFKVINDSLGHDAGDRLLIAIAERLATAIRGIDTLSRVEPDQVARLGGDEFVVLLDTIRDPADAIRVCQRIQDALSPPYSINGEQVRASASLGIAISNGNYNLAADILRDADTALYSAKNSGRGNYRIFHPDMHASAMRRLWMESELRHAIDKRQLSLVYQPIFALDTGKMIKVEALVRWQHPERGMIPPADFIALAEEAGLIFALGDWVLQEACRQMKRWQTEVPELACTVVGVNVSCSQFARRGTLDTVRRVLNETGLEARYVRLELTESAVMDNVTAAIAEMTALRDIGVQFHLDDFGTGYSSLGCLHRMPIAALKIDRSFISTMGSDRMSTSIVQAIIALAHSLDMQVIAEGVENEAQRAKLTSLGCDYAQGYHFAGPLSPDDLVTFARKHPTIGLGIAA